MMKDNKFRQGRSGCESKLFAVRGYLSTTPIIDEDGKPTPQDVLRICANEIDEVIDHVRKWEKGFDIRSIRMLSLVVMLSGSPYNE